MVGSAADEHKRGHRRKFGSRLAKYFVARVGEADLQDVEERRLGAPSRERKKQKVALHTEEKAKEPLK